MKQLQAQDDVPLQGVDSTTLESRRVPLERKAILKFHDFGGFFVEYSANVSLTGMFIRTESPKPPGSVFIFEIWLGDEHKLVHGLGEVIWTRESGDGVQRPAGMGVRYLKMDEQSRAVVQQVIAAHLERGGEVFDLELEAAAQDSDELSGAETSSRPQTDTFAGGSELLVLDEEELLMKDPAAEVDPLDISLLRAAKTPRYVRILVLLLLLSLVGGLAYLVHVGGLLSP